MLRYKLSGYVLAACVAITVSMSSCKKELTPLTVTPTTNEILSITAPSSSLTHPGRTLAANCFQCHGTDGFAGELKIASMSVSELLFKLNGFAAKDPRTDIMNFHAKAYTADELNLIADYFSKQN